MWRGGICLLPLLSAAVSLSTLKRDPCGCNGQRSVIDGQEGDVCANYGAAQPWCVVSALCPAAKWWNAGNVYFANCDGAQPPTVPPTPVPTFPPTAPPAPMAEQGELCKPKCSWECTKPECQQECKPLCHPPNCHTYCKPLDSHVCYPKCAPPECTVVCPNSCSSGYCPQCRTVCAAPKCEAECTNISPMCESHCGDPVCTIKCDKPEACPKPQCSMICTDSQCNTLSGGNGNINATMAAEIGGDLLSSGQAKLGNVGGLNFVMPAVPGPLPPHPDNAAAAPENPVAIAQASSEAGEQPVSEAPAQEGPPVAEAVPVPPAALISGEKMVPPPPAN